MRIAIAPNRAPMAGMANVPSMFLVANGLLRLPAGCRVRTVRDRTRLANEVVYSIPDGKPYDPRPFPKGIWRITGVSWQQEARFDLATYGPVKILTDAWQMVRVWELDRHGDYLRETDELVRDEGYWLHYSDSRTTLGCIRLDAPLDASDLAKLIEEALGQGEAVELEV